MTCSYGSTCVQSSDGLSAKCMCPLGCEGKAEQTVCGSDGRDYRNECELHQHACKNQKNLRVQYPGRCGESPGAAINPVQPSTCICEALNRVHRANAHTHTRAHAHALTHMHTHALLAPQEVVVSDINTSGG